MAAFKTLQEFEDHIKYLDQKKVESIVQSIDRKRYPERYTLAVQYLSGEKLFQNKPTSEADKPSSPNQNINSIKAFRVPIILTVVANLLPNLNTTSFFLFLQYLGISSGFISVTSYIATAFCTIWVGRIAYRNIKKTIVHPALCGPVFVFFTFTLISTIASLRYASNEVTPPDVIANPLFANQYLLFTMAELLTFLTLFPIAMGLAAIGAFIERKKQKTF